MEAADAAEAADAMTTSRMKRADADVEMMASDVVTKKRRLGIMQANINIHIVAAKLKFNIINKAADAASFSGYGFYPAILIRIKNL